MNHLLHPARLLLSTIALVAVAASGPSASAQPARPATEPSTLPARPEGTGIPVRTVVLFSSGVGYFEHFGKVEGSGTTELRFKTRQINDILKSLILQDLDGGKVTAISYPSQDPIDKTLKSFQVDITRNPSLGELLTQLRGAKVKVYLGGDAAAGTVLGVEKKEKKNADHETVERWVLNLYTGMGVKAVDLEAVTNIDFDDAQLRAELGKALAALSESRDQDKKPVTINFNGEKERRVRLGYVVETPIWKTSYRLILGDGKDAKSAAALQGWAIVENQTDNDWVDVQLSLVSGRPISFIQDLYQPLYVPRPILKPRLFASLRPQTYEGGISEEQEKLKVEADAKAKEQAEAAGFGGRGGGGGGGLFGNSGGGSGGQRAPADTPFDPTASVNSLASANKIGELFQYTVGNVSLPRQRSAMIPIITDPLELERLSIYNVDVMERYPLYGARIKNTTKKHLLAGPITVIDAGSYAGDANIEDLPPGQERFISYGVDLEVNVLTEDQPQTQEAQSARIDKGVLVVTRKQVSARKYIFENKGSTEKTLILEHAIIPTWELADTEKPMEKTEDHYRFKRLLPAGKRGTLMVTQQAVMYQLMALLSKPDAEFEWCAKDGAIPQKVKEAIAGALKMKAAAAQTTADAAQRRADIANITVEQTRIRENMKTVNQQQSEYYTRLLKKLNDQESEIEKLQAEAEELRKKAAGQIKALETYLGGLNVE